MSDRDFLRRKIITEWVREMVMRFVAGANLAGRGGFENMFVEIEARGQAGGAGEHRTQVTSERTRYVLR